VTTIYLVRHALHDRLAQVLVGRMPGVSLGEKGRMQACRLAEHLTQARLTQVHSSPRARARETAAPIALRAAVPMEITSALDEIDVGEWTGQTFAELRADARWAAWNTARGSARPPSGESMQELQRRVVNHLDLIRHCDPDGRVVAVTHAEPIRAAVLHCLGMPLDEFARIEIAPAAVSTLAAGADGFRLVGLNEAVWA
jgi:broad specificity phosphatase PhoE